MRTLQDGSDFNQSHLLFFIDMKTMICINVIFVIFVSAVLKIQYARSCIVYYFLFNSRTEILALVVS
jgi:hypothetical protein